MKWINKGHEFDKLGTRFKNCRTIYLYGATNEAKGILETTEFAIKSSNDNVLDVDFVFVDRDVEKQKMFFNDKPVISPERFYQSFKKDEDIVLLCLVKDLNMVSKQLITHGMKKNIDFFDGNMQFYRYVSLFIYYRYQKLFIHFLDTFAHTNCNLKCIHCAVMSNMGVRTNLSIEQLKKNIDLLFNKVDSVGTIVFGVAEGFLGANLLREGIIYVLDKYSERFLEIEIVTNGTIKPPNELIKVLRMPKVHVVLDDYRENVKLAKTTYPEVEEIFKKNNIKYIPLKRSFWYDSGFNKVNYSNISEEELSQKHFNCIWHAKGFPFHGYNTNNNRLIYNCSFQAINSYLHLFEEDESDSLNIETASPLEIIEFILGYTEKGYLTACTKCHGMFEGKELTHIPVAEQI